MLSPTPRRLQVILTLASHPSAQEVNRIDNFLVDFTDDVCRSLSFLILVNVRVREASWLKRVLHFLIATSHDGAEVLTDELLQI